jgi:putative ABC transport system permease protein
MKSVRPPLIPRVLLHLLLRGEEREVICGDLEEEYRDLASKRLGSAVTKQWYWRQALRAVTGRSVERFHRMGGAVRGPRGGPKGAPGYTGMPKGGDTLREIGQDVRFGLRALGRRPMFTVVAGLTLALGVGANTAMFSVLDSVLLKPLDYPDSRRIVQVWSWRPLSKSTLAEIEGDVSSFSSVSGYVTERLALTGEGAAEEIPGAAVSPSHFSVVGIQPAIGRAFTPEESEPGRDAVVILSDELWSTRFGSDPDVLGMSITLDGSPTTVVGVMPSGYRPIVQSWRVWVPLTIDPTDFSDYSGTAGTKVLARLEPGATPARARAELAPIARALREEAPQAHDDEFVAAATVTPLLDARVGSIRSTLWLLLGSVGLVLLIACANVTNLLLAQGRSREREMAVRQSQGASRGRLVRQLLTESTLLGLLGGAVGVLVAIALLSVLRYHLQGGVPRGDAISVDYRVLLFATGTSLVTVLVFGLIPALRAAGTDVNASLRDGGCRGRGGRRGMNQALVGLEIAMSLVLLAGAGLLLKSSWLLQRVDPGFRSENLLTMRLNLPAGSYSEEEAIAQYFQQVEERVAGLPGVISVGSIWSLPMRGSSMSTIYEVKVHPLPEGAPRPAAMAQFLTPGTLKTMGIRLVRGRWFDDSDSPEGPTVAVINEAMAREAFGKEDPVGQEVEMFGNLSFTVVGVVGDVRQLGLDQGSRSEAYFSLFQIPAMSAVYLTIRTAGDPAASIAGVLDAIARLDADVPVSRIATMDEVLLTATADSRLMTLLFSLFAGIALVLGVVGVYGVVSHSVSERTYEIGVRMALGARSGAVVREVMGKAAIPVGFGLVVGIVGAYAATRLLDSILFEVQPADPAVLLVVTVVLGIAAMIASLTPARRAATIDPARCLNTE